MKIGGLADILGENRTIENGAGVAYLHNSRAPLGAKLDIAAQPETAAIGGQLVKLITTNRDLTDITTSLALGVDSDNYTS